MALDALRAGEVIVPGAAGRAATAPAMARKRVMWAFTDKEAYLAWASRQPDQTVAGWTPATIRGGRRDLGRILEDSRADTLVLNPAGPGVVLWPAGELGDLHASATLDELVVRVRLAADPTGVALTRTVLRAAYDWSHVGQACECSDLLAVGGRRVADALDAGDPDPCLRQAIGLVAAQLAILGLADYRADADAALDWARRFPPQPA